MSFKDLTNKESALDKAKGVKKPDKATTGRDPANTPEKPQASG